MKKGKIIWGLVLIAIAALIIAGGFGILPNITWRLILSILLVVISVKSIWELEFFGIFFPLAIIGILYSRELHIEKITPMPVLAAALLLSIGFSMIFGKATSQRRARHAMEHCQAHVYRNEKGEEMHQTSFGENTEQVMGDTLFFKNSFGAASKYVNTDNFQSASLENSFGELKVYFDNAIMQQPQATIMVSNSLGETQIYLPKTWNVENQISATMGTVVEKNRNMPENLHKVLLTGSVTMGEVQIIYI